MHLYLLSSFLSSLLPSRSFFFFNDTATTEIYTLSLHDALPISIALTRTSQKRKRLLETGAEHVIATEEVDRSEEHTSELQSPCNLVCRLLLEKKKNKINKDTQHITDTPL